MTHAVPIRLNVANALQWLGTLYRNPADAIKEHVSNALDEHMKAMTAGIARKTCSVAFTLERSRITIEYGYGMSRREFEGALQRVADSMKQQLDIGQIGRLGIGLFSFQQIGKKCTIFSRKRSEDQTIKVILREGAAEAEFSSALKKEELEAPGIRLIISELKFDPTKARGPLSPERLTRFLAEKFDRYLRDGLLEIRIWSGGACTGVQPRPIELPILLPELSELRLAQDGRKRVHLELYFDPSGGGGVAIRHQGVAVVENLRDLAAYGLEDSVYASGFVKGYIDADFLTPLPARTGFEENNDWVAFLDALDKAGPTLETEVEELRRMENEKALSNLSRRALELAREILGLEEFYDLEFPGGRARAVERRERNGSSDGNGRVPPAGKATGERSLDPGERERPGSLRINYQELPFEDGGKRHSRFLGGIVQVNSLNAAYRREMSGDEQAKLAYMALMIGKEAIAYNDRTKSADEYLERLLGFYFSLRSRLSAPRRIRRGKRAARSD